MPGRARRLEREGPRRHLALLYDLVSLATGCVSIGLCLMIYREHRKSLLRDYALFLASAPFFFHRIGDATVRRVLRVFFFISLGFFPLMLTEVLRERLTAPLRVYDLFELFALPSYFLVINVSSIVLCIRTLNQPPFLAGGEPTDHFAERFGITRREGEIVQLLADGRSYSEVADSLFISYKTVDNHVQSIYQKTGVRNRLQLANLLQANRGAQ